MDNAKLVGILAEIQELLNKILAEIELETHEPVIPYHNS